MTIAKLFFSRVILAAFLIALFSRPSASQSLDPATVEGTVVQVGSSNPLPRTRVTLISQDGRIISPLPNGVSGISITMTAMTDDNGRFAFSNVPPGNYQLIATRDGYVKAAFGNNAPRESGKSFRLMPKQELKNVVMSMTPTSTIAGRIKNRFGEPMGNVTVQAHRYIYQEGRRLLNSVLTVLTNDLGEFRLYYLEPGQYIVTATPSSPPTAGPDGEIYIGNFSRLPGSPLAGAKNPDATTTASALAKLGLVGAADTGETYLPVFFPGTTEPSGATPIDLRAGASFENANFTVTAVRAVRIRGQILNSATGQPARGAHVLLMSEITGFNFGLQERGGTVSDTGAFEFRGVAPGTYDLVATIGDLPENMAFSASGQPGGAILETFRIPFDPPTGRPTASRLVAKTSIQVGSADLSNIALSLGPGYKLGGRISVEGQAGPESDAMTSGITIQLIPDPETFESAPMPAPVGPNGAFTVTGLVPGSYQIAVMAAEKLPPGSYVKSVQLDNLDAINPRLVVTGEPRGQLEIVLGSKPGFVTATVVNASQAPAPGITVVLVPDAPRRQHFDLYHVATTNDSGVAGIGGAIGFGIDPGNYTAYAWENIEAGSWWDPAFLAKYEGLGKPVRVLEGGSEKLDLKILPIR